MGSYLTNLERGPTEARLRHGPSVWAFVMHLNATGENPSEVARAYDLPPEAVQEALDYYHEHKAVIDARVLLNIA